MKGPNDWPFQGELNILPWWIEKNRAGSTQCQEGRVVPEVWDTKKRIPPGAALQVRQRFAENAGKILCCLVASLQHLVVAQYC